MQVVLRMISYNDLLEFYFGELKKIHIVKLTSNDIRCMNDKMCNDNFIHASSVTSMNNVTEAIAKFILFSAYSKIEIEQLFSKISTDKIYRLVNEAYEQRFPDRRKAKERNGIYSEVFLDLILTIYYGITEKFSLRHYYRQKTDRQEIKGYDSLFFFNADNGMKKIVLGQAKMGSKSYCTDSIIEDIKKGISTMYLCDQMYFYADKPLEALNDEVKKILRDLNEIGKVTSVEDYDNHEEMIKSKNKKLVKYLAENSIEIIIPCLFCYEDHKIYSSVMSDEEINDYLSENIYKPIIMQIGDWLSNQKIDIEFSLFFIIFPFDDISKIRNEESGVLSYVDVD